MNAVMTEAIMAPSEQNRQSSQNARPTRMRGSWASSAVSYTILTFFLLYSLLPLLWLAIAATKDTSDLYGTGGFALADLNLFDNLARLFEYGDGIYLRWLFNSFVYAGVGALVSVVVSFLTGYAFDKFDFPGKERWFGFVLVGVLVPAAVTTMPLYLLASRIGLVNTFWGVFLPAIASPFGVYMARIFSASYVPLEVVEAARIDGASELRIFFRVAVPMMWPGFVTVLLMSFSGIWNNFYLPRVMLTDPQLFPVSLGIYAWNGDIAAEPQFSSLVVIGSAVAIIPVMLLFVALQRYWKAGIGAGALK